MVLSDPAKSGLESAWIDGYDSQSKDKNITITKIKILLFFHAVSYSKNHVIPHPVIAAILNVILNILQAEKQQNMLVKFSKYNRKLLDIITNCEFDFRLNFALNSGHLGHLINHFKIVNQTCECFILIVCFIRPLNIDKKSK